MSDYLIVNVRHRRDHYAFSVPATQDALGEYHLDQEHTQVLIKLVKELDLKIRSKR